MAKSAEEILKRYQEAMASTQTKERYKRGIERVTESPMAKAATPEAMALYLERVKESVDSGRREQSLMNAPLSRYKDNAMTTGAERLQTGAKKSEAKHRAVLAKWAPVYAEASAAANALPKGDLDAGMARCRAAAATMKRAAGKAV